MCWWWAQVQQLQMYLFLAFYSWRSCSWWLGVTGLSQGSPRGSLIYPWGDLCNEVHVWTVVRPVVCIGDRVSSNGFWFPGLYDRAPGSWSQVVALFGSSKVGWVKTHKNIWLLDSLFCDDYGFVLSFIEWNRGEIPVNLKKKCWCITHALMFSQKIF
jgi:hypothetical protein